MRRKFLSMVVALALLAGMTGTALAAQENAAAASRSGVARVLALYELYLGDTSLGLTSAGVGSSFGVGTVGKETAVFVTNRHVVGDSQREWSAYELIYAMQGAAGLKEYSAQYEDGTVLVDYKLTRAYLLLDDYAYSDSTGLDSSRSVPCSIIYIADEDEPDLAVLRAAEPVKGRTALPLAAAEGGGVEAGDTVYALGYPYSADAATTDKNNQTNYAGSVESVTITTGVVSRFVDYTNANARIIQHDAAINGGNSGGPLINEKGAVVGVNTITFNLNGVNSTGTNHSGSVASEHVMRVLDSIGVKYEKYSGFPTALVVVLAVVIVLAAAAAVVILRRKKTVVPGAPAASGSDQEVRSAMAQDSGLRLQCLSGTFAGRRFAVGSRVRIGRDPAQNDLVYPAGSQGVSGVHCVVIQENGALVLKDLGSTYGTFLFGGQRLAANQPVQLKPGDRFYLGSEQEMFQVAVKGGV